MTVRRGRRARAAVMLEFIMVFPMALVIVMFSIDIAKVYMASNATQYAAAVASRTGATYGAAGASAGSCVTAQSPARTSHLVLDTFCEKLSSLPGGTSAKTYLTSLEIGPTNNTPVAGACSTANASDGYVKVSVTSVIPSIVPGLNAILGLAQGSASAGWRIRVTQEVRCEIVP